jgi:hypothetical protein
VIWERTTRDIELEVQREDLGVGQVERGPITIAGVVRLHDIQIALLREA